MQKMIFITLGLGLFIISAQAQDCASCHRSNDYSTLEKSAGIFQKAVGVMDKGQVQINTGNFGTLSSFHVYFTNAVHWPASAAYERQYSFGLGFMVGVNEDNVIETETQSQSKILDWLPPDDARGVEFSGEVVAESDDTPFMASSDLTQTWPDLGWPGYFRVDVNSLTETQLDDHPNALSLPDAPSQFSSDRDLFATYNDAQNPRGSHGITVEQTGHSYGRNYAEDLVFWDLKIFNDGGEDLDSIYIGLYAKFRPDFDNHDYLNFVDSDNDGIKDLVYVYDLNNTPDGAWTGTNDPLGMVGIRVFDTPGQIGITDFHHFSREASPATDQEMWALMSSKQNSEHLVDSSYYFHGSNSRIDDTGQDAATVEAYYPPFSDAGEPPRIGNGINYVISCGPFDLKADSMTTLSFGLIMGDAGDIPYSPDTTDLMVNVRTAQDMYRLYFQGSGPPDPPEVHAVPGDGQVSLYWDASAENSRDAWTGDQDFEGYRIYRSSDAGLTWGRPITDSYGNAVGYDPIAQFDYSEEEDIERYGVNVSGPDPAFPQNLGDNTGLFHTFTDSNLVNGVEYWYSVSAYDRGNQDDLANPTPSYMNAQGQSWHENHTVRVTPGKTANDLSYGGLEALGGVCQGIVTIEVEDPEALKNLNYLITFDNVTVDIDGESADGKAASVLNELTGDTLINQQFIVEGSDENTISLDGLLIYLEGPASGVETLGWTKVEVDTCTFDWRIESKYPNLVPSGQAVGDVVETFDDWRLIVDYETGVDALWLDAFSGDYSSQTQHLPLRVEVVTDPNNPIDVTEYLILAEFNHGMPAEFRPMYYSPTGWDLVPGGLGWLSGSGGWYEKHVDMLILEKIDVDLVTGDTIPNYLYLLTNNKPDTSINKDNQVEIIQAVAPTQGDEFTILTYKPFRPGITYHFNPLDKTVTGNGESENPLDDVYVVPDPYIVTNAWETSEFGKKLMFTNLPSSCTIKIYTILGELVDTVEHGGDTQTSSGFAFWNMRTRNDQFIAPGVYLYHAETPDGHETAGRFLVIK